jgi:hypothetical protein
LREAIDNLPMRIDVGPSSSVPSPAAERMRAPLHSTSRSNMATLSTSRPSRSRLATTNTSPRPSAARSVGVAIA